jgi:rRNA biogenesis protein RRP5
MVDLGVSKVSCFLHDDNVPGSDESTGKELLNGQPVLVSILTLDKGHRAATCTLRAPAIGKNSVSESTLGLLQLDLLRPGLLVNARVKTVDESGLRLTFGGLFSGTVHYLHLPAHPLSVQKPVSERYKVDQKLRARVLAVDIGAKTVSLTLKDSLVNWNSQAAMLSAQGATATAIDGKIGRAHV